MTESPNKFFSGKFIYSQCLNVESILSKTDTFEEYPLLYRVRQVQFWKKEFPNYNLYALWVGYAVFLLGFYENISKIKCDYPIFLCLTISNFDVEEMEDGLYMVPAIFTSTFFDREKFINKIKENSPFLDSKEMLEVKTAFKKAGALKNFCFYESRFYDALSETEMVRIYCINHASDVNINAAL